MTFLAIFGSHVTLWLLILYEITCPKEAFRKDRHLQA
jgi:hypothetical protein